jgi:hypothetical protein
VREGKDTFRILVGQPERKRPLKTGVDEKIIVKLVLKKWGLSLDGRILERILEK